MLRKIIIYTPLIVLSIFFIFFPTGSHPVAAITNNTAFKENPLKPIPLPLVYDTFTNQTKQLIKQLDKFYTGETKAGFNGSVLIGYKGRIIYERYFGFANREAQIMLSPAGSGQLASISKTFTATAVLYLYEHKYLDINDHINAYLSDFPYPNVTIKMLLSHRSGIPDYSHWYLGYKDDFNTPISNNTMYEMMAARKPRAEFKPGTRFKYCNTNYAILALLIEKVTGIAYPEFMTRYIFKPLGMDHTFIYCPGTEIPYFATRGYDRFWRSDNLMFADGVYGDKSVYSTVEDMYRWDQSFYRCSLLSKETIDLAYTPYSFERPGIKNYGLGWRMLCFPNGNKVIYHNGWWHGANTSFYRFINDNLTIIVIGNRFNKNIYRQAPKIFSILRGAPEQNGFDTDD